MVAAVQRSKAACKAADPSAYYSLAELLGQGSFAHVWKAVDKTTGTPLAVKIYRSTKCRDPTLRKMIETEIRCVRGAWRVAGRERAWFDRIREVPGHCGSRI